MHYLGGKARIGGAIAAILNDEVARTGLPYWEPFVGSAWVAYRVRAPQRTLSDACGPLIHMWRALQGGWTPPEMVDEEMFEACKRGDYDLATQAFVGFACSYAGIYQGGFARHTAGARGDSWSFPRAAARVLVEEKLPALRDATFLCVDYRHLDLRDRVVYCDPPYGETTGYPGLPEHDVAAFWERVVGWASRGCRVFVSEYSAPASLADVVWERKIRTGVRDARGRNKTAVERLYRVKEF